MAAGVCLQRPPKADEYRTVAVVAASRVEAEPAACQMAACASVMPACSEILAFPGEEPAPGPV